MKKEDETHQEKKNKNEIFHIRHYSQSAPHQHESNLLFEDYF